MKKHERVLWAALSLAVFSEHALAQSQGPLYTRAGTGPVDSGDEEYEAKGAGILGGAIAGAEVVVAVEALFKVKALWPYLTFGALGAAGGGVGGYFLEQASAEGSVALVVGAMALIIPTAVLAASARAFDPAKEGAVDADTGMDKAPGPAPDKAEEKEAKTDTEERPAGAPTDELILPEETPSEDDSQPGAGEADSDEETDEGEPGPDEPPDEVQSSRGKARAAREAELARIRREAAGALFYVDAGGAAAVSMPSVEVRPSTIRGGYPHMAPQRAVEIIVPVFKLTLP